LKGESLLVVAAEGHNSRGGLPMQDGENRSERGTIPQSNTPSLWDLPNVYGEKKRNPQGHPAKNAPAEGGNSRRDTLKSQALWEKGENVLLVGFGSGKMSSGGGNRANERANLRGLN